MVTSLQRTLPAICEDVFKNLVLASFERSCQEMFRQVDESFRRGTMECAYVKSAIIICIVITVMLGITQMYSVQ